MEKPPSSMGAVDAGSIAISTPQDIQKSVGDDDDNDIWGDDGSICSESNEAIDRASDLDREWQRRHDQFHTIGYRDGLTAGKEASAQEGFNAGFKKSVLAGYKWGLVRGVSSALACLPNDLKDRLVSMQETREKLQNLYESSHSISTHNALKMFYVETLAGESEEQTEHSEENIDVTKMPYEASSSHLGKYIREFESLDLDSTSIKLHSKIHPQNVG